MCFEMEAQSSGGDIGPECLQSDDSYSLDAFSDIDALIADLHSYLTLQPCPYTQLSVSKTVEFSSKGVSEAVLTLESIGGEGRRRVNSNIS